MTTARDVIAKAICWGTQGQSKCNCVADSNCAYYTDADEVLSALYSAPEPIRQELAALLNPWRPIETAPFESAKRFWVGKPNAVPIIAWRYYHDGPWLAERINVEVYAPTHWLHLPVPPSEDKT
jgi:hypothetical protein